MIWTIFFVIAILGVIVLMFHLVAELNELDRTISGFAEEVKNHYGTQSDTSTD